MRILENYKSEDLKNNILEGIFRTKGQDIVYLDLSKFTNAIAENYIICHADSSTQVSAIASSIQKTVKENMNLNAWHCEGYENSQWILIDYGSFIIHVFQKMYRDFYKLEELWSDAAVEHIEEEAMAEFKN
jgi:ribosome-associated protein